MCQRCEGFAYKNFVSGFVEGIRRHASGFFTPGVINHVPFASLRELLRCKTSFRYFHWVGRKKFSLTRVCPWPVNCNCGTHNSNLRTTILRAVPLFWKIISLSSCRTISNSSCIGGSSLSNRPSKKEYRFKGIIV